MRELKASELRVGNWVVTRRGYSQVTDIRAFDNQSISYSYKMPDGEIFNTASQLDEVDPVTLTEEILLKCGFERIGGSAHIKSPVFGNYEWIELDWDGDHFNVFYRQENTEGEIDTILQYIELVHIHELQNWWKVNTGEELNVQL